MYNVSRYRDGNASNHVGRKLKVDMHQKGIRQAMLGGNWKLTCIKNASDGIRLRLLVSLMKF